MRVTCYNCKEDRGVVAGTLAEKEYFRVIPVNSLDKIYFCTPGCYLERCFMDHIFLVSNRLPERMNVKEALSKPYLRPYAKRLRRNYQSIIEPANNHPAFRAWCHRMGYDWNFIDVSGASSTRSVCDSQSEAERMENEKESITSSVVVDIDDINTFPTMTLLVGESGTRWADEE